MSGASRLICHPFRVFVEADCKVLQKQDGTWEPVEQVKRVVLPVDSLRGNQDPYVWYRVFLYGYCRNANMPALVGPGSVLVFGTWLPDQDRFLVDTVLVVRERYDWGKDHTRRLLTLSPAFVQNHPSEETDALYRDFLKWGIRHGAHFGAKAIFEGRSYEEGMPLPPVRRDDPHFSFIPLRMEDGVWSPVDIMPVLRKNCPHLFARYGRRRNRVYKQVDTFVPAVLEHLFAEADTLVTGTMNAGSPDELDMDLQKQYYRTIYKQDLLPESICCARCGPRRSRPRSWRC